MDDRAGIDYRSAGVDLDAAERAKGRFRELVASTRDAHTLSELGSFGGLYAIPSGFDRPILVSSTDGVGTKLKIAFLTGRHDTVGQDLVNHCVNDILAQGARPLFFLDYLATGEMDEDVVAEVVSGVAIACRANRCALLGGETAQMPDFYASGEYDLAGFVVGIVDEALLIDGSSVRAGDLLVAVASNGLHTNGFTLARRILFGRMGLGPLDAFPGTSETVADVLLRVHRSYLQSVGPLLREADVHAAAHVTGGGIPGNLPRVLRESLGARIDRGSWTPPPVFVTLADAGHVEQVEMDRVFNMGVGMVLVTAPTAADRVVESLERAGERAWVLGEVVEGSGIRYE